MQVFTIAPRLPFADMLAARLLAEAGDDPLALARLTILLPTRRARRTLREAFLRRSAGRPLILPRLAALGDLDEDETLFAGFLGDGAAALPATEIPPAIPPLRRQLLLTRLILAMPGDVSKAQTTDQAARLAGELGRLLDQVQTEGLSFDGLATLVPDRYAAHWQITLTFLEVLTRLWPALLESEGCLDPADRRNRLLRAQAVSWQAMPPAHPVIAAGITGSIPAAAELLAVIAGLPQGRVVLPGLDRDLDEDSWQVLEDSHPQHALKRLLETIGIDRAAVADWPVPPETLPPDARAHADRERLASELMRPALTTHLWRGMKPFESRAIDGLVRLDCPTPREEALAIALLMREAVETPDRTAALVTPDRDLARRVAAELRRWKIVVDDSAGRPLAVTPPGAFLRLTAAMISDDFAPVPLLTVLKHPLCAAGLNQGVFRDAVRRLETAVLRGVRPAPGLAGLRDAVLKAPDRADTTGLDVLLDGLEACCAEMAGLMAQEAVPFSVLLDAHMRLAEALCATADIAGPLRLWAEDAGETAAALVRELTECADTLQPLPPLHYGGLLDTLMGGQGVRTEFGSHPRLSILGPMESRLHHADLMILGGLNEDVWPPVTATDPWMSRPMRGDFGLPQPEQKVGHTAHDFVGVFCAPRIAMTRAEKVEGTPTVPSRWLLRLETAMAAGGLPKLAGTGPWLAWAENLDLPDAVCPMPRPAPTPPVLARPTRLSVTRIETWMRDPYALYAEKVLGLRALAPLDAEPGAADYGTLVHKALELFIKRYPKDLPDDAEAALLACGEEAFAQDFSRPGVWAFWWPRFQRLAGWLVTHEAARRPAIAKSLLEIKGETVIDGLTLTAKADRIDLMSDGTVTIIDYKTGKPPPAKEVAAGYAPQLPLEAVIAMAGGFPDIAPDSDIAGLLYWHLKGDEGGGKEQVAGKDPMALARDALAGLRDLIRVFSDPDTPYECRPHPRMVPTYSDYGHLARIKEWSAGGDEGGEA